MFPYSTSFHLEWGGKFFEFSQSRVLVLRIGLVIIVAGSCSLFQTPIPQNSFGGNQEVKDKHLLFNCLSMGFLMLLSSFVISQSYFKGKLVFFYLRFLPHISEVSSFYTFYKLKYFAASWWHLVARTILGNRIQT